MTRVSGKLLTMFSNPVIPAQSGIQNAAYNAAYTNPGTLFSIKCAFTDPIIPVRFGDQIIVLPSEKEQRHPLGMFRKTENRIGRLIQFPRLGVVTGHGQFYDALLAVTFEKRQFGKVYWTGQWYRYGEARDPEQNRLAVNRGRPDARLQHQIGFGS